MLVGNIFLHHLYIPFLFIYSRMGCMKFPSWKNFFFFSCVNVNLAVSTFLTFPLLPFHLETGFSSSCFWQIWFVVSHYIVQNECPSRIVPFFLLVTWLEQLWLWVCDNGHLPTMLWALVQIQNIKLNKLSTFGPHGHNLCLIWIRSKHWPLKLSQFYFFFFFWCFLVFIEELDLKICVTLFFFHILFSFSTIFLLQNALGTTTFMLLCSCLQLHYDHLVLLDYLISKDSGVNCAQYLLRYTAFCFLLSIFFVKSMGLWILIKKKKRG